MSEVLSLYSSLKRRIPSSCIRTEQAAGSSASLSSWFSRKKEAAGEEGEEGREEEGVVQVAWRDSFGRLAKGGGWCSGGWSLEWQAMLVSAAASAAATGAAEAADATVACLGTDAGGLLIPDAIVGDGLRVAAQSFLAAAAYLAAALALADRDPQDLDDLRPDTLRGLQALAKAQAQECFFYKAVGGRLKDSVLAMLAAGTAAEAGSCLALLDTPSLRNLVPATWPLILQLKQLLYATMAQVFQARAAGTRDAGRFGEQVALLTAASATLADIERRKLAKRQPPFLLTLHGNIKATVARDLAAARHDNDIIYHDPVPPTVPQVTPKVMVRVTPWTVPRAATLPDGDPFAGVVPMAVKMAQMEYLERKRSLVAPVLTEADEQSDLLKGCLASMSLPGALDAVTTTPAEAAASSIPPELRAKATTITNEGGVAALYDVLDKIVEARERAMAVHDEIVDLLDGEEAADAAARERWGHRWPRSPSHALAAGLRREAAKLIGNLEHARKSDAIVRKSFDDVADQLTLLSGPAADLAAAIPSATISPADHSPALRRAVTDLRAALSAVDSIVTRRAALRDRLSDGEAEEAARVQKALLDTDSEAGRAAVYEDALAPHYATVADLRGLGEEQATVLDNLSRTNDTFVAATRDLGDTSGRTKALQRLEQAHGTWRTLRGHTKEGVTFYQEITRMLDSLRERATTFVHGRDTELKELTAALEYQPPPQQQQQQQHQQQPPYAHSPYAQQQPQPPFAAAPPPGYYQQHMPPPSSGWQQQGGPPPYQ
jgi:programmed cell death 6-interacting protein